jgi:transposase
MQTQFRELTDAQWDLISPFLPLNRKRKHNLRLIFDVI